MKKTFFFIMAAIAMCATAVAKDPPPFAKVPADALTCLKATKGKPVRSGLVFVNGEFVPSPYSVMRYGTALKINRHQVTGQIVSWKKFIAASSNAPTPPPAAKEKTPPKKKPAEANSVDDLFDDEPPPSASAKTAEAEEPVTGDYVENARTKALLRRLNDARTTVHRKLLDGYVCFFGSRYVPLVLEPGIVGKLLDVLPEAMRDAESPRSLLATLKGAGFNYFTIEHCEDLIAHSADSAKLIDFRRKFKEDAELRKLIDKKSK